jgi:hypothetical protein
MQSVKRDNKTINIYLVEIGGEMFRYVIECIFEDRSTSLKLLPNK